MMILSEALLLHFSIFKLWNIEKLFTGEKPNIIGHVVVLSRKVVVCVVDDDLDYYIRYSKDMVWKVSGVEKLKFDFLPPSF